MLRPSLPRVVLAFVPVLAGCSALINPDTDLLGTDDGTDSGVTLMDSGVMGVDAGPMGIDAGDRPCVEGTRSCAGDQLVSCVGGMEVPQDCQSMEAFCDVDHCTPHVCVPNSRECSADGTSVVSCNGRGSEAVAESCGDARCDPATRTCVGGGPECPRSTATIRIGGTYRIGLCTPDDSDTFVPDGRMCTGTSRADSGDRVFTLTLDAPTRVTLELTDIDERRAVDTILYVRRNCDDPSSQILCADDVPCAASTAEPAACFDGVDVRQSRVTADLPAGTYYVILDAFLYSTGGVEFECGQVQLRVDRAGVNLLLLERRELSPSGEVLLDDERARHLLDVLGVVPGQYVRVGVVDGPKGRAEVLHADEETVRMRCELDPSPPERPRLDLVLAVPRPKVLKRLWAPLAALGVGRVDLTNAKRVERYYFDSHAVRPEIYGPRLLEGLTQARDTRVPEVRVHRFFRKLIEDELEATAPDAKRLIADPIYPRSAIGALAGLDPTRRVVLAIGPEGGWDPFERDLLERHAFTGIGLGTRTLRSDTAVIGLVSIVHEALRVG